jgi:hypothetical protein
MRRFLTRPPDERRFAFLQAGEGLNLPAASVEKDFWVCWTLAALTSLPDNVGRCLTLKGGTSLSKAWHIIDRFSEDIDIVIDKEPLGFSGNASPELAPSKRQRRVRLELLRTACQQWVQMRLQPMLATVLHESLGSGGWTLRIDPDAGDGQCLLLDYTSVFPAMEAGYVRPVVKIEMGARSDDWPWETRNITPYVAEALPHFVMDAQIPVRTLTAERTFWEKAMLLHEETFRPADKPRKPRMARHYYDLWCLTTQGVAERAVADHSLFDRVAEHREVFFRLSWVDYATIRPGSLRLLPPDSHLKAWRRDFDEMRGPMFFGEVPTFDEVLRVVGTFEKTFNGTPRVAPPQPST